MRTAIDETNRRRELQRKYNEDHGIIPRTIVKAVGQSIRLTEQEEQPEDPTYAIAERMGYDTSSLREVDILQMIDKLHNEMMDAAANLEFEIAAKLRDEIAALRRRLLENE